MRGLPFATLNSTANLVCAARESRRLQGMALRRDGRRVAVEVEVIPAPPEAEALVCALVRERSEGEASRDSNSLFKEVLDFSSESIFWANEAGRLIYVNEAACTLLGYDRQTLLRLSVFDIAEGYHPDTWPERWAHLTKACRVGMEAVLIRREGRRVSVEISANMFRDRRDTIAIFFVRDVTEQKKYMEQIEKNAFVLSETQKLANIGHSQYDVVNDRMYYSEYLSFILGVFPRREATLASWLELIHPDDREAMRVYSIEEVLGKKRPFDRQYRIIRPSDGQVRWVHGRGAVILDDSGHPAMVIGPIQDITESKLAQEQIQQTIDALTRSNVELERFAYVASHDLQEPIRNIVAYTQLLAQRYRARLDEDADEFLGYIVNGAKRMQALVLDLLEYSRLSAGGQPFTMVDLGQVVRAVSENLRMALRDSGACLTTGSLPVVYGDEIQLVALFQNLIGNAIKFRRPEVAPRVHVGAHRGNRAWILEVSDNGIGMEAAYLDKIFLIFKRLHTIQAYPGTGIGLAVARRIVERHGGAIDVESTPGHGSRFLVTLPDPMG
ncbi:sensor histidine kinase [Pararhodospirillum oryzae]|uniref:histidine kinase n=1 Tax=Pararhodospirillum oryzae TaxID=478448 RepID=A0A512HA92_9PROT|nr:PAS domain S-box protein [Pararhodospirillum oryzae]GEO82374.1 hypothetical protein ROR02_25050 [Pararhodospirillum oryzae]